MMQGNEFTIEWVKYIKDNITGHEQAGIIAKMNGLELSIPKDENNRHYKAILAWVADGNTIEAAD